MEAKILPRKANELTAINKLPFELVVDVLLASIEPREHRDLLRLQQLASIQALWWDVIRTAPQFWAVLYPMEDVEALHLKLRKSGNFPLTVIWGDDYDVDGTNTFMATVLPHRGRWRVIEFDRIHIARDADYMSLPMPRLESVTWSGAGMQSFLVDFAGGSRLRTLQISWVNLKWEGMQLSGLRALAIHNAATFALSAFVMTLRGCSDLRKLSLRRIDAADPWSNTEQPFHLPNLELLELHLITHTAAIGLIRCIQSRNIRSLILHLGASTVPEYRGFVSDILITANPPPSLLTLLRTLGESGHVNLHISGPKVWIGTEQMNVSFQRPEGWYDYFTSPTGSTFSRLQIPVRIFIGNGKEDEELEDTANCDLSALDTASSLSFVCSAHLGTRILGALIPPGYDTTSRMSLPNLRKVLLGKSIRNEYDFDDLDEFVETLEEVVEQRCSKAAQERGICRLGVYEIEELGGAETLISDLQDLRSTP